MNFFVNRFWKPAPIRSTTLLLDRDGTIIVDRGYMCDPMQVELLPNAVVALRCFRAIGFRLVIVTNQSGLARGTFTWRQLDAIHARLRELLAAEGVEIAGIYVCPHFPGDGCHCRKPRTGLVAQASRELGFSPQEAIVIGDKPCDVELGRAVAATSILVRTGEGARTEQAGTCCPDLVANDLLAAARWVAALFDRRGV